MDFAKSTRVNPEAFLNCDTVVEGLPPIDLTQEVHVIEGNRAEDEHEAHLLLRSRDLPVSIENRGKDGMVAVVRERAELQGRYKIRFAKTRDCDGGVLLVELVKREVIGSITRCWFRYLAAWAKSEKRILSFLITRLGQGHRSFAGVDRRENGWFFTFDPNAKRSGPTLLQRAQTIHEERRQEYRTNVRQGIRWFSQDGSNGCGNAYNVSRTGVHVIAEDRLPPQGETIKVVYPLNTALITLVCRVIWAVPDSNTPDTVGGFSVEIEHVDDGAHGSRWLSYVKQAWKLGGAPG